MKSIRLIPALLCVSAMYFSCVKQATPVASPTTTQTRAINTRIDQVKENVNVPLTMEGSSTTESAQSIISTGTADVNTPPVLTYQGYTRQYVCGSPGSYTYTFSWQISI